VTDVEARPVELVAERCRAQLLSGRPAGTPADAVRRLLAVQGQDPRGVRLAIRARTAGLTAADVDRAMTADRSLLITWLNRGTLHLVATEDYWWLQRLTTPPIATAISRRLAQEGVSADDADKAVSVIDAALADGPLACAPAGKGVIERADHPRADGRPSASVRPGE
jgi:Winged helix DNA-binding domain